MSDNPNVAPAAADAREPGAIPNPQWTPDAPDDAPAGSTTDAIIDQWFADHIHGSIVARDTDAHNFIHAAIQDLKLRIAKGNTP